MSRVPQLSLGVRWDPRKPLLLALLRVDANFIGLPTEQWGVSNNARPTLRAARFEEASFKVAADTKDVVIDIKVAK